MKLILTIFLFLILILPLASCDIFPSDDKQEDGYNSAMEQLEEEGKVSRSRRIDLVREVIKANEDYTNVEVDKEKIGIE